MGSKRRSPLKSITWNISYLTIQRSLVAHYNLVCQEAPGEPSEDDLTQQALFALLSKSAMLGNLRLETATHLLPWMGRLCPSCVKCCRWCGQYPSRKPSGKDVSQLPMGMHSRECISRLSCLIGSPYTACISGIPT